MTFRDVPLPERMQHLPRDKRGYPIPVIVEHDQAGAPVFAANDHEVALRHARRKLCPICGARLTKELWFVGGPLSAFHPLGAYFDSAMHHECMTYAMQVCPYMALPNYRSTIDAQMPHLQERIGGKLVLDSTMIPGRPPCFVAVMAYGQSFRDAEIPPLVNKIPLRPYHAVEFWKDGARLTYEAGRELLAPLRGLDLDSCLRLIERDQRR